MKLVAILRVKDQILTIRECLDRLVELVDEIVVVDNGSTDGTLEVYKKYPQIVAVKQTKGFDEGRDKILAHQLAKARQPDWILWIDADEVFEEALTRVDLDKYMTNPSLGAVWFRLYHFWGSKTHYRIDGPWLRYTAFPQRMMWRETGKEYFRDMKFHNGGIMGVTLRSITSPFRLKHFGYVYPEQIQAKQKTYGKLKDDPMSVKTMSMDIGQQKHYKFRNKFRRLDNLYWNGMEKIYTLLGNIKILTNKIIRYF